MSVIEIKSELQKMIENEKDLSVLQAIRTLLKKTSLDPMLKEKLTVRHQDQRRSLSKVVYLAKRK